jgi:5-methyltetrahydrofolate--homocysteine methyltransferase
MDDIPLPLPFLLDGGMETALQAKHIPEGVCPAQWMLAHADSMQQCLAALADAGADGLCAPTGGANRAVLASFGLEGQADDYNSQLTQLTRQAAPGKPILGVLAATGLETPPQGDSDIETLVAVYAQQVSSLAKAGADWFLADSMTNVAEARAAILAVRETVRRPVFVTFACDGDGRTETGGDILAALIICQGMGAAGFGIGRFSGDLSALLEQIQRLSLHAQIPLMVLPSAQPGSSPWKPEAIAAAAPVFAQAGVRIWGGCASVPHLAALRAAVDAIDFSRLDQAAELEASVQPWDSDLPCASEREAQFISPLIDVGEEVVCSPHFVEDLLAAEEAPTGACKIVLDDQDDVDIFAENQYMIEEALCLSSDSPVLLERALRLYNGRAFYDGTGDLEPEVLLPLVEKYGLIVL